MPPLPPLGCRADGLAGADETLVWNFPLDLTYSSTNVFGWPQIILTVFSVSANGKELILGYGCVHLPTAPGRWELARLPQPYLIASQSPGSLA